MSFQTLGPGSMAAGAVKGRNQKNVHDGFFVDGRSGASAGKVKQIVTGSSRNMRKKPAQKIVSLVRLLFVLLLLIQTAASEPSHPALTADRPLAIAHRGGVNIGPENRLVTIKRALVLGVDGVEVDIHQSADGHLMVLHDLTLDRCFGVPGRVDKMTRDELKAVGVPTLEDVVELVNGRCLIFIEIKQPKDGTRHLGFEKRLIDFLRERQLREQVVLISFYPDSIEKVEELAPEFVKGLLLSRHIGDLADYKERLGVEFIGPRYSLITPEVLQETRQLGLKLNPWTVNGPEDLRRFLDMGCAGITTNDPHLLVKLVRPWFMEP
jgi:glycerophosphoryl diester phosphodiesterase